MIKLKDPNDRMPSNSTNVMEWKSGLVGPQPVWKVEPQIELITDLMHSKIRDILQQGEEDSHDLPKAAFLGGGALNKLYWMEYCNRVWILRVSLPVDPYYKTASEVATLKLLESSTSLPVPRVIAHYAGSTDSPAGDRCLGLEWILMTKLPGKMLEDVWDMGMGRKSYLVEIVADKLHELYMCNAARFPSIGNIYETRQQSRSPAFSVGRIVSMPFFWDQRLSQPAQRGPFTSSAEWFTSRLQLVDFECNQVLESELADEDDKREAAKFKSLSQRLMKQIPEFVPENEKFVLHHDDINTGNLLVNPNTGSLTGIVDWECVSVLPNWKSCQLPLFLMYNATRNTKPSKDRYHKNEDGSPNELYYIHFREWEVTVLGQRFLQRMEAQNSDWMEVYQASEKIRDFDHAVSNCDDGFVAREIDEWLAVVETGGRYRRLVDND
ncbi:hypothetical protein TWF506_004862 [Arthrobotrys conoides]|uniref:Aminoglycoside phosphotransferase domain-containing protein n=1 Tax=Arthrobotrys conoides TaxID=74498 RepID=A0AAN8NN68_9PEZI